MSDEIRSGDLLLNLVSRRAFLGDKELVLSPKEFSLLAELMRHQGAVLSRDLLLTRVWGYDFLRRQPDGRRPRALAAREDRRESLAAEPHHDRARHRLPVRRLTPVT